MTPLCHRPKPERLNPLTTLENRTNRTVDQTPRPKNNREPGGRVSPNLALYLPQLRRLLSRFRSRPTSLV